MTGYYLYDVGRVICTLVTVCHLACLVSIRATLLPSDRELQPEKAKDVWVIVFFLQRVYGV